MLMKNKYSTHGNAISILRYEFGFIFNRSSFRDYKNDGFRSMYFFKNNKKYRISNHHNENAVCDHDYVDENPEKAFKKFLIDISKENTGFLERLNYCHEDDLKYAESLSLCDIYY